MRRDPIVIGPYDPSWPASFDAQQSRITPALAPWLTRDIEHMGSTAVPGLPAKDIVDMLAVVAVIQPVRSAIEPMAAAGWLHAPEPYDAPESRLSFCFPSIEHRTHHLHVVEDASPDWRGWLAFRDRLPRGLLRRARVRVPEDGAGGGARRRPRPARRLPRREGGVHPRRHRSGVARRDADTRAALRATPERPGPPARG